jgi:hypothetical protein
LAGCSHDQSSPSNERHKQNRFYDYVLYIEFLDPFLGLEKSYTLNSDTLTILDNTYSKEGKLTTTDTVSLQVMKPYLDTIYSYAAELFAIDKENLTDVLNPRPPYGEGEHGSRNIGFKLSW